VADSGGYGPWNPGIQSHVPKELRHLSTIFRPENVLTSFAAASELRGLTGLPLHELVAFRPQRLLLHELLIRLMANFAVPSGSRIEDLGINFREMARVLLARHIEPQLPMLLAVYDNAQRALQQCAKLAFATVKRGWGPEEILECERRAARSEDACEAAACRALARIMSALFATQGAAWGGSELIVSMAVDAAGNEYAGDRLGAALEPLLVAGAAAENYKLLSRQARPVVINTKGPSASGKSSLRPMQRILAGRIGVDWNDLALISPDIWRKQLLDYASLGDSYKYAGAFAAEELQIVDQKLDGYMSRKARRGEMSHLLIDRFRFDSFAADSDQAGSNLLTRFGDYVHLFFLITPPASLVERAWNRGLEWGRYKAVDDTLAHAVEAYSGIPDVFFTWISRGDKRIQFEFLDNSVRRGERPRTVAFGDNATFNLFDVGNILNIVRYARIDVDATSPDRLYARPGLLEPANNLDFLKRCVRSFRDMRLADQVSGRVYLRIAAGTPTGIDAQLLEAALRDPDTRAGIEAIAPAALRGAVPQFPAAMQLGADEALGSVPTLGAWGTQIL
jgi:hypothetical protein